MNFPQSSRTYVSFFALILIFSIAAIPASAGQQTLSPSSSSLHFGKIAVGSSESQVIDVTNPGSASVTVSSVSVSGAEFTVSGVNLPVSIGPGQTIPLSVTFRPAVNGWMREQITLSDTSSTSVLQIMSAGTGVNSLGLTASPSSLSFGSVSIGSTVPLPVVLTNSRSWNQTIDAFQVTGSGFSITAPAVPLVLGAGQSVTVNISFSPQSSGLIGGSVFVVGPNINVPLVGTGVTSLAGKLIVSPTSLNFGSVNVGTSTTQPSSLSASGGSVTISAETNNNPQFQISGISLPVTIAAGQTLSFDVVFSPTQSGSTSGSVVFASNAFNAQSTNLPLAGTGVSSVTGKLIVSPTSLSFGSVNVGSSTTQPSSLSATGGSITISAETNNNPQFQITGISLPVTIPAGQTLAFDVVFSPTQSGSTSGSLVFASNASNAQSVEAVSGSGVAVQKSVNLSWNASTSSVAGYNVYRGTSVGAYSKINSSMDPATSYADSAVVSGATYYYTATAVNSSGQESGYSAAIKVAVP